MAVKSNTEWKVEEAVIGALAANLDIVALDVPVQRAMVDAGGVAYPLIAVQCSGAEHPLTYGGAVGIEEALVEIFAYTARRADPTTEKVTELLGAIRDTVRDDDFKTTLSSIVDFTAFGTNEEGFSRVIDTDNVRVRSMSVRILCNVSDI